MSGVRIRVLTFRFSANLVGSRFFLLSSSYREGCVVCMCRSDTVFFYTSSHQGTATITSPNQDQALLWVKDAFFLINTLHRIMMLYSLHVCCIAFLNFKVAYTSTLNTSALSILICSASQSYLHKSTSYSHTKSVFAVSHCVYVHCCRAMPTRCLLRVRDIPKTLQCGLMLPETAIPTKRRLWHYQRGKTMRGERREGHSGVVVEGQPGLC